MKNNKRKKRKLKKIFMFGKPFDKWIFKTETFHTPKKREMQETL